MDLQTETGRVRDGAIAVFDLVTIQGNDGIGLRIVFGTVEVGDGTADMQLHNETEEGTPVVRRDHQALRLAPGSFGEDAFDAEAIHVTLEDINGAGFDERLVGF